MKQIFKYEIKPTDRQEIELPIGSEILTIQTQFDTPFLWAMVHSDEDVQKEKRTIRLFATGEEVDCIGTYINTFQLHGGSLVFHAYEIR